MKSGCNPLDMIRSDYTDIDHDLLNAVYKKTIIWFYAEGIFHKNEEYRTVHDGLTVIVHIAFTVIMAIRYIPQADHKLKILFGAFNGTHQPTIANGTRERDVIMFRTSHSVGEMIYLGEFFDLFVMRRGIELTGVVLEYASVKRMTREV